jgi:hypothetical protein
MEYDENGNFVSYVTMNIEDIQVGDLVYSYDTATGEETKKAVTATFVRESDHINYLTIVDEKGHEQTIETTNGHPFWVVTDDPDLERAAKDYSDGMYHGNLEITENGYWVEAKDLRVGDVFLGANGELSTLTNIVRVEQGSGIAVFNFEVEGNNNYFILAKDFDHGQSCVLVHNALLYRNVGGNESINRLRNKAAEAKDKIGIHGVSVSETTPVDGTVFRTAQRSEIEKYFPVHNTKTNSDPLHKTIELPEPLTPEAVKVFNNLFGG